MYLVLIQIFNKETVEIKKKGGDKKQPGDGTKEIFFALF
jgi:hypothetical protein